MVTHKALNGCLKQWTLCTNNASKDPCIQSQRSGCAPSSSFHWVKTDDGILLVAFGETLWRVIEQVLLALPETLKSPTALRRRNLPKFFGADKTEEEAEKRFPKCPNFLWFWIGTILKTFRRPLWFNETKGYEYETEPKMADILQRKQQGLRTSQEIQRYTKPAHFCRGTPCSNSEPRCEGEENGRTGAMKWANIHSASKEACADGETTSWSAPRRTVP